MPRWSSRPCRPWESEHGYARGPPSVVPLPNYESARRAAAGLPLEVHQGQLKITLDEDQAVITPLAHECPRCRACGSTALALRFRWRAGRAVLQMPLEIACERCGRRYRLVRNTEGILDFIQDGLRSIAQDKSGGKELTVV